ncbi:response regulator [Paenibacillus thailandensis]|uniref:histidine kinase n=1 Tax=Paenibacillus thailandensis TaxID=393250 RepID=A0ABW5R0Y7_9BACL
MNRLSLRTKGLLFVVLISLIPLLIAGLTSYSTLRDSMMYSAMEQASRSLGNNAMELASWLDIRRGEIHVMSHADVLLTGADEEKLDYLAREKSRFGSLFHSLGYISPDGSMIRTDGTPVNVREEDYARKAMKGQSVITDPFVPFFSDQPQVFIVVPVFGEERKPEGAVYASILLSKLEPFFGLSINEGAETRVYNKAGEIVYKPAAEGDGAEPSEETLEPLDTIRLEGLSGTLYLSEDNKRHLLLYSKVNNTPWYLVSDVPQAMFLSKLTPVYLGILASIALAELVLVLVFFAFFNRIVRRLKRILAVTEQAAAHHFETEHLEELPGDEIGQLARSVNGMTRHLSEMFERLEAIINQNRYAFIILNEEFRITGLNKAAEELVGYRLEELQDHATPLVYMDEKEIVKTAEQLSARLGRDIRPGLDVLREIQRLGTEQEWTFIAKDGTRKSVAHVSTPLSDRNGRFAGVVGIAYDISEKKRAERTRNRLLDIVESAKDLIASVDRQGRIVYMNGTGRSLLGMNETVVHRIKPFFERGALAKLIAGAKVACREGYWESEMELVSAGGKIVPVSMIVVTHLDSETGEMFYSCIARDIYEQKAVQEELIRAKLEAEEANNAKSRFLALMSHEIRTPLNGIIGLSQLLRKTGLSETQKEYMDKIGSSSDTLLRLINDILDYSKIEAGKADLERFAFSPEELLSQLAGQLGVFMGGKENFEFMIETPPDLPVSIVGDPFRLEQILLNLCMNAIKFTENGRVKLSLAVTQLSKESAVIQFVIEDTGIGMSKEQLSRLFKPFTQADGSTTRKYGGTGLGLVIATHFLEMMGSRLKVESEEGTGSRFYFSIRFPIAGGAASPIMRLPEESSLKPVWVVEDDPQMAELLCGWLESFGLVTVDFRSWKAAKDRLARVGPAAMPDMILLDMEMEDMYGIETWMDFQRKATEEGVSTAVMTTTYGREELLQLPGDRRPSTILTKPLTRLALFRALSGLLEQTEQPKPLPPASEDIAETGELNHGRVRILLAEDNKINQLVSVESLKGYGFVVGVAENGQEALEKLEAEEWHLVLMDIHMPVMDGEEAVRRIRSRPKYAKLPIIALTANGLKADHDRYIKLGMNDCLTKPVDARVLYETIARWIGKEAGLTKPLPVRHGDISSNRLADYGEAAASMPEVEGIDMRELLNRVGGKQAIALHMLQRFKADYASFCEELVRDLDRGELASAKRRAHTLKGAAGNLSAGRIMSLASTIDQLLQRPGVKREEWIMPVHLLEKELTILLHSIEEKYIS